MGTLHKPLAMSVEEVRAALNQWSSRGFFRVKRLGDTVDILEIRPRSTYTLRVRTQYEERSLSKGSEPYHGGPVDDNGAPPDPWDVPVLQPRDFATRSEILPMPHTERVQDCPPCGGGGNTSCVFCHGIGSLTCSSCSGCGFRAQTETRSEPDGQGNMVTRAVTVQGPCGCAGGRTTCTSCGGVGRRTCTACAGSGRVKVFDRLTVCFRCPVLEHVFHGTALPDHLLVHASGEPVVDEHGDKLERCPTVIPAVEELANKLLTQAHAAGEGDVRILFQHLHIERVGVQEVLYRWRRSADKRLWIYGHEQSIHAPGAPLPWAKLLLVAGGLAFLAGLIYAFSYF